jgi:hypothetical protein
MGDVLDLLTRADARLEAADERIQRQAELVMRLQESGNDTADAVALLMVLRRTREALFERRYLLAENQSLS